MNTCDICKESIYEAGLIWITSEDFTPLKGEQLVPEAMAGVDAVCPNCYGGIIRLV